MSQRIFLYEAVTAGGLLGEDLSLHNGLLEEGRAMIESLAADFSELPSVQVVVMQDARLVELNLGRSEVHQVSTEQEEYEIFCQLAKSCQAAMILAPEIEGQLLARVQLATECGAKLLSPDATFVALASDKHRTADFLRRFNIRTPDGILLAADDSLPADFSYPALLKPIDGAGSTGIQWVESASAILDRREKPSRLEPFVAGQPVSVAALCGPRQTIYLPACRQILSDDGKFSYLGGSFPLAGGLALRAERLARKTLGAMPRTAGYVGIDMILAADSTGDHDTVVEVNPRLTTSYVGLRRACQQNLAAAMLATVEGKLVEGKLGEGRQTELHFSGEPTTFSVPKGQPSGAG